MRKEFESLLHNTEITLCIMREWLVSWMQKTLPSQKILRRGFRIGIILHESSVYSAYEKHWYIPRNAGEIHSGMGFFGGKCFWRSTPRQEHFIAELTDVSQKTTPDVPKWLLYAELRHSRVDLAWNAFGVWSGGVFPARGECFYAHAKNTLSDFRVMPNAKTTPDLFWQGSHPGALHRHI